MIWLSSRLPISSLSRSIYRKFDHQEIVFELIPKDTPISKADSIKITASDIPQEVCAMLKNHIKVGRIPDFQIYNAYIVKIYQGKDYILE